MPSFTSKSTVCKILHLCLLSNLQFVTYINPSLANNVGALSSADTTWCLCIGWGDTDMPVLLHCTKEEPFFLKCHMLLVCQE